MKLDMKSIEGRWVTFQIMDEDTEVYEDTDVEILIKPWPTSKGMESGPETGLKILEECLVDWKGLYDQDGKKLKCDAKNKAKISDYGYAIGAFVVKQVKNFELIIEEEVKN